MSQAVEATPWVIITVFREDTSREELGRIAPQIQSLVDGWQGSGRIMWSGAFNDNATGMAVFEGTEREAAEFYDEYDKICSGILQYSMYQWDAMPILSVLGGPSRE